MSSEKKVDGVSREMEVPDLADIAAFERDWTVDEERRAKRKLDLVVMPLLMLGFFCLQLDRGNVSNAITSSMLKDVGISQNQFNVGQQLLSTGIVLFEIPANLLLYKFGPGKWLSCQVIAFGLVSTFQAFQKGYGGFLATRLLLGLSESGYIPGGLYTLSTWYTKKETAKRVMIFFIGNLSASASSNLIAYGILHMDRVAGKAGWFWLFVIMGLFTIASGFVLAVLLPDSFQKPTSFLLPKISFFTQRELHILRYRVWKDDPIKSQKRKHVPLSALKRTLTYWPLYIHVLITLCNNGPLTALGTYTPTIISSFGYPKLKSNALASVGLWVQIPVAIGFSYLSDRFNWRAGTTVVVLALNLLFTGLNRAVSNSHKKDLRYGILVMVQTFYFTAHPLNVAWMSLNARSSEERVIAMAMIIMAANAAGIYGAQLFRADDKPLYHRALSINIGIIAAALAFAVFLGIYYWRRKRSGSLNEDSRRIVEDNTDVESEVKVSPSHSPALQ